MSRKETRARRRRARIEQAAADFSVAREDPAALVWLLKKLAGKDAHIWRIAGTASKSKPLDDAENAMIAEFVSPRLAGKTPGSVMNREERMSRLKVSGFTPKA